MAADSTVGVGVPTARGDTVAGEELGLTLMHEHIFGLSPEVNLNYPDTWGDEEARVAAAIEKLNDAKARGVDTIVDVTVLGLGRYIPRIQRLAEAVDLNIVVATGIYAWANLPMFFAITGPGTVYGGPETMDDLFVADIENGIGDTDIRPGIIKCAIGPSGPNPDVDRTLRAVASAHRRTGVPITVHTQDAPNGTDAQRIFEEEGVDLSRVVIGHLDRELLTNDNYAYAEELISKGSLVAIDQIGIPWIEDADTKRMDLIAELCKRGHADHLVMSHDSFCFCDMMPAAFMTGEAAPNWTYTTVPELFVPGLRERGVSEEDLITMTRTNPRRMLESAAAGPY